MACYAHPCLTLLDTDTMSVECDIGLIGLAVMGQNLVLNIESRGFRVAVYNRTASVTQGFVAKHAGKALDAADTLGDFVGSLSRPRKVLIMVQAGAPVDAVIQQLIPLLAPGDIVVDCGNSLYTDTERRDAWLTPLGLRFVGAGVSGGEEGARKGPSIMPGGPASTWQELRPVFEAIAARAEGEPCVAHIGPGGAGHFVKMVHNGVEYGMMAALAEGFDILKNADVDSRPVSHDAETAPRMGNDLDYRLPIGEIAELWRRGSVVQCWLLDLIAVSMVDDPELKKFSGRVSDSGEGRWTIMAAIEEGVPADVLSAALYARFRSQEPAFSDKVCSAMRYQFGGHVEKPAGG